MKVYDDETQMNVMIGGLQVQKVHLLKYIRAKFNYALCDEEVLTTIPYYETFGLTQSIAKKSSN